MNEKRLSQYDDAELEALLDEALAGEPAPAQLTAQIMAATTGRLPMRRGGVLARIGWRPLAALAAGVALAVSLSLVLMSVTPKGSTTMTVAQLNRQLDELASVTVRTDEIDREIKLLQNDLDELANGGEAEASWLALDQDLAEMELSSPWDSPDVF